jgi:CHAT domain-containing protein/Tfp pilus assembly protein PilF
LFLSCIIFRKRLSALIFLLPFYFVYAQDIHFDADSLILNRADRLFESGRFDSAVKFYVKYLSTFNQYKTQRSGVLDQKFKADYNRYLNILLRLGTSYNMISSPDNALFILKSGFSIADSGLAGGPVIKALLFYQIGNACLLKMDYQDAIRNYQKALVSDNNDIILAQKINQNLGGIFFFMEDYDNAIEHYQKALVAKPERMSEDPAKTVELLINIGSAYVEKNEFHKAMEYYSKAEKLFKRINTSDFQIYARLFLNLGNLLMKMNNPKPAYDQFMKAYQLYERNFPVTKEEMILLYSNIARFYQNQMTFDSTIIYLNLAISCIPGKSGRNLLVLSNLYHDMGETYGMQKNWKSALEYYQKALDLIISDDPDSLASSLVKTRNAGKILEIFRMRQDKAKTLYMLGLHERSDDLILQSFNEYLIAIDLANRINQKFGTEGPKLFFNESAKNLYDGALETGYFLLTHDHKELEEQLFLIAEKSRDKILFSVIMDNIAKSSSGIPDSLLNKEVKLDDEISFCIRNLWLNPVVIEKGNQDRYLFYLNRLIEDHWEIDSLAGQYMSSSPAYCKLREQEAVRSYSQIRQKLLSDEALIEYFIGDTNLFIFLARSDSLIIKRIPVASDFKNEISKFNKGTKVAEQQNFFESGYDLYCQLILPVKSSLNHIRKLIIIPDENLATIPFEALISDREKPTGNSTHNNHAFLINDFEICYHFSSALWFNSPLHPGISKKSLNYGGFAPVNFSFEKNANSTGKQKVPFTPLPFTKDEIQDVSDLIFKNGGTTHLFLDHNATEKNFRDHLEDYSIIHIATHSLINDQQPGLSGLVFFPDKNEDKGKSIFEELLFLDEVFNLRINADLLVLSACATGTGKITRSEGVLAMTRGFFTAGASNIIYTLWNVTDKHTRDFMVSFFKGILAGQTYSCALRNAKLEMISKPETSLPRLWAPYVLLGR